MADGLRRKIALSQLERAKNVLDATFQETDEDDEDSSDVLGALPSLKDRLDMNRRPGTNNDKMANSMLSEDRGNLPTWKHFFDNNELVNLRDRSLDVNTYYTLPSSSLSNTSSIPIFIFHHGAGSSGLSFANLAKQLTTKLEGRCGCFAFDARGHSQTRPLSVDKPRALIETLLLRFL